MIDFYSWDTPNGRKISVALELLGLPYTTYPVDITNDQQFAANFLRISPNNKIPVIVDRDGIDGSSTSIFESGAILLHLAEKTGQLLPASQQERLEVLQWLFWQVGGFGPMPGQYHVFLGVENEQAREFGLSRYGKETRRLYAVLNKHLADRAFVARELSIADVSILGWVWRHWKHKVELADFPNVERWYQSLMAKPAIVRGFEIDLKAKQLIRPSTFEEGW